MTDLRETIPEWRNQSADAAKRGAHVLRITRDALDTLLDAAERAEQARDAALEEVKAELRAAYVTDEHNTLGFMDALEIVEALRRPA